MNDDYQKYADIINLPHYVSKKHPRMSMEARAAQFAPFAALAGYEDAVEETARLTEERIEIDEEVKKELNKKLQIIKDQIAKMPEITFVYFIPDEKKKGGRYAKITGNVKKVDEYNQTIILTDKTYIPIKEIIEMTGTVIKI